MIYLAQDWFDWKYRAVSCFGICACVLCAGGKEKDIRWLFDNGRGRKTNFAVGDWWLPTLGSDYYTARIMLLELGALMSEEEGN